MAELYAVHDIDEYRSTLGCPAEAAGSDRGDLVVRARSDKARSIEGLLEQAKARVEQLIEEAVAA